MKATIETFGNRAALKAVLVSLVQLIGAALQTRAKSHQKAEKRKQSSS